MEYTNFSEIIGIYEDDNKNVIDSTIKSLYQLKEKDDKSDGYSNVNGWQKDLPNTEEFQPIKKIIEKNFAEYLNIYTISDDIGFKLCKFFGNINPPGAYHPLHYASTLGEFTGVYYLKVEEDSGELFIMNPFPNSFLNSLCATKNNYNCRSIKPCRGRGVFHYSGIPHFTDMNRGKEDRITVVCHIRMIVPQDAMIYLTNQLRDYLYKACPEKYQG
tara:strand:+ start:600 stop:1247 length:648 start_codon:yes stop_codon:yes gene_type:complete